MTALVTGASKRLGAVFARTLAQHGHFVFVHHHTSHEAAEERVQELRGAGLGAAALVCDLSDPRATEALMIRCAQIHEVPTVLVNSASVFVADTANDFTIESWRAHMDVNLLAPALLCRELRRHLPVQRRGLVVNVLDYKLENLNVDFFSYTVSKYALRGVTELLARAYAPHVRVCGLAPGLTLPSPLQTTEQFERIHDQTPLARGARPEDLARALSFILETPSYTGQMLMVDGGQHLDRHDRDVSFFVGP